MSTLKTFMVFLSDWAQRIKCICVEIVIKILSLWNCAKYERNDTNEILWIFKTLTAMRLKGDVRWNEVSWFFSMKHKETLMSCSLYSFRSYILKCRHFSTNSYKIKSVEVCCPITCYTLIKCFTFLSHALYSYHMLHTLTACFIYFHYMLYTLIECFSLFSHAPYAYCMLYIFSQHSL